MATFYLYMNLALKVKTHYMDQKVWFAMLKYNVWPNFWDLNSGLQLPYKVFELTFKTENDQKTINFEIQSTLFEKIGLIGQKS